MGRTLSSVSTRFSASAGLSGGEAFGDCSAHSVVETMKGISCDATPSFTRSSSAIGGWSNEWISLSVGRPDASLEYDLLCKLWFPSDISIGGSEGGNGGRREMPPHWRLFQ